jgi:ankyrin repeat protein
VTHRRHDQLVWSTCFSVNSHFPRFTSTLYLRDGNNNNKIIASNIHWHCYNACRKGDLKAVRQAFISGFNMNQILKRETDNEPYTALCIASMNGSVEIVEFILQNGVHVDHTAAATTSFDQGQCSEWTRLYWAIRNNYEDVVQLLLQFGAYVHLMDSQGRGYLHYLISDNCGLAK